VLIDMRLLERSRTVQPAAADVTRIASPDMHVNVTELTVVGILEEIRTTCTIDDTIDDLHWKTDGQAASFNLARKLKKIQDVLNGTEKVRNKNQETDGYGKNTNRLANYFRLLYNGQFFLHAIARSA